MSVSMALEKSARDFCFKYSCNFNFKVFESSVEEFTFFRPIGGWNDVYKMMFKSMYMQALESAAKVGGGTLDSEAMLDDFEYTLIRPYVREGEKEIKHMPYTGMDRVSRLEYLQVLTSQSPSNSVDLYIEKYRNGEISIKDIRSRLAICEENREHYIEMAGFVQALEAVSKSRSLIWRFFHPFKNKAEKSIPEQLKKLFMESSLGGEKLYTEATAAAYETFDGYQRVNARLEERMIHAREELNIKRKMNDVMRESLRMRES